MSERPIIFSAPMVRALLAGTKTQTRRLVGSKAPEGSTSAGVFSSSSEGVTNRWSWLSGDPRDCDTWEFLGDFTLPFRPGDRLWVREGWRTESDYYNDLKPTELSGEERVLFDADADWSQNKSVGRRRASFHMPRWASRITLAVTDVRVERLQEISEADARAEGASYHSGGDVNHSGWRHDWKDVHADARSSFRRLWNSIHGQGAWEANPWVVALTFKVEVPE